MKLVGTQCNCNATPFTYSMEQSHSWEANRFAASQKIPRILWNPKVHEHMWPSPVPILSQLDPVHTPTSHFLKSILILSSHLRLGLPSGLFPSGFPNKTLYTPLPSPIRPTYPAQLILLDFITRTILGEQYRPQLQRYWRKCYRRDACKRRWDLERPQARVFLKKEIILRK